MAIFGQRAPRSACLSPASMAAKPCARFVHDRVVRLGCVSRACATRSRYSARGPALRARMRSVTERTRSCKGAAVFTRVLYRRIEGDSSDSGEA